MANTKAPPSLTVAEEKQGRASSDNAPLSRAAGLMHLGVLMHGLSPLCRRDNWAGFVAVSDSLLPPHGCCSLHPRFDVSHDGLITPNG